MVGVKRPDRTRLVLRFFATFFCLFCLFFLMKGKAITKTNEWLKEKSLTESPDWPQSATNQSPIINWQEKQTGLNWRLSMLDLNEKTLWGLPSFTGFFLTASNFCFFFIELLEALDGSSGFLGSIEFYRVLPGFFLLLLLLLLLFLLFGWLKVFFIEIWPSSKWPGE